MKYLVLFMLLFVSCGQSRQKSLVVNRIDITDTAKAEYYFQINTVSFNPLSFLICTNIHENYNTVYIIDTIGKYKIGDTLLKSLYVNTYH